MDQSTQTQMEMEQRIVDLERKVKELLDDKMTEDRVRQIARSAKYITVEELESGRYQHKPTEYGG